MLRNDAVDNAALNKVADDIGELIDETAPSALFEFEGLNESLQWTSYEMTDTFAVWMIDYDEVMSYRQGSDAFSMPKSIDRWHHQIRQGGTATGYARSAGAQPDAEGLREVVGSELAARIDAAITVLDDLEKKDTALAEEDWVVRLLVIPAYQVHAFWLVNEASQTSRVLIIDGPAQLERVARQELISLESLIDLLRAAPPAAGLGST